MTEAVEEVVTDPTEGEEEEKPNETTPEIDVSKVMPVESIDFTTCSHTAEYVKVKNSANALDLLNLYTKCSLGIKVRGTFTFEMDGVITGKDVVIPKSSDGTPIEISRIGSMLEKHTLGLPLGEVSQLSGRTPRDRDAQPFGAIRTVNDSMYLAASKDPSKKQLISLCLQTVLTPKEMEDTLKELQPVAVGEVAALVTAGEFAGKLQSMTRVIIENIRRRMKLAAEVLGVPTTPEETALAKGTSYTSISGLVPDGVSARLARYNASIIPPPGIATSPRFGVVIENNTRSDLLADYALVCLNIVQSIDPREKGNYQAQTSTPARTINLISTNKLYKNHGVLATIRLSPQSQTFTPSQTTTPTARLSYTASADKPPNSANAKQSFVCPDCVTEMSAKFLAQYIVEGEGDDREAIRTKLQSEYPWLENVDFVDVMSV